MASTGKAAALQLGMFDSVALKTSWSTYDMQGWPVKLRKGQRGCVLQPGKSPASYIIEFHTGRGMRGADFTHVNVPAELLEAEHVRGKPFEGADRGKPQLWY